MTEKKENRFRPCWSGLLIVIFLVFFMAGTSVSNADTPGAMKASQTGDPWYGERSVAYDLLFPRAVYSFDYGDPTAAEQAHLEAINRARLNPPAEAARLGIDLYEGVTAGDISGLPVQPLVLNSKLLQERKTFIMLILVDYSNI